MLLYVREILFIIVKYLNFIVLWKNYILNKLKNIPHKQVYAIQLRCCHLTKSVLITALN